MKISLFLTVIYLALSVHAMDSNEKPPSDDGKRNNVVINPLTGQLFFTGGSDSSTNTCGIFVFQLFFFFIISFFTNC